MSYFWGGSSEVIRCNTAAWACTVQASPCIVQLPIIIIVPSEGSSDPHRNLPVHLVWPFHKQLDTDIAEAFLCGVYLLESPSRSQMSWTQSVGKDAVWEFNVLALIVRNLQLDLNFALKLQRVVVKDHLEEDWATLLVVDHWLRNQVGHFHALCLRLLQLVLLVARRHVTV